MDPPNPILILKPPILTRAFESGWPSGDGGNDTCPALDKKRSVMWSSTGLITDVKPGHKVHSSPRPPCWNKIPYKRDPNLEQGRISKL